MKTTQEPMNASAVFCPNENCCARGKIGEGNIVIHERARPRYRCKTCGKSFSAYQGTMFEGLRKPRSLIVIVVTLLTYGCPLQAIVHAFGLDERTVAAWRDRAGVQCQRVHEALVEQGRLDLVHVQADEIRVKGRSIVVWMGLAMMVSTRLWLAGAVSQTRDRHLADRLLIHVRACAQTLQAILVATDGWAAYPNSIKRAFREKVKETIGRGRSGLRVWKDLCIVTVIKRTEKKRVVEVTRTLTYGKQELANDLLQRSLGGSVWNTAFIERINGTFRERLAVLTRKCRHAARRLRALETGMYLVGCTYNLCFPHHELSKAKHLGFPCTPAMAASLTDHPWSISELLSYRSAPPPWVVPKRRGRPRTRPSHVATSSRRAVLRLRKGVLCPTPS
jgi:transposase-like protein/IS1 family transposase